MKAWDGEGQFSEGVQNEVSRAAAKECFVPAAKEFARQTQVSISGRTVERIAEQRGAALAVSLHEEEVGSLSTEQRCLWRRVVRRKGMSSCRSGRHHCAFPGWLARGESGGRLSPRGARERRGQREVHCTAPSYVVDVVSMDQLARKLYVEACKRGLKADNN